MQLSIIIVNYNVRYYLEHCLIAVQKASAGLEVEVIVVDNASHDNSRHVLPILFPEVQFVWNEDNLGFSKACNIGLAKSEGDYILFLNPDTLLSEDALKNCLDFFDQNKDCCGLGVKMIDGKGRYLKESKRLFPNPARSFWKICGMSSLFPKSAIFSSYYASNIDESQTAPVEVLSGAFMMISRKLLPRVNGFDEDFFMYAEDIDLSYRLQRTGFRNFYLPTSTIIHFKGASTEKSEAAYIANFYGAMKLFVKKHYGTQWQTKWILIPAITLTASISNFKRKIRRRWQKQFVRTKNVSKKLLIVGSDASFNEMIHLIKHAQQAYTISGRVALEETDAAPASCMLSNIGTYIKTNHIDAILFCGKDCTYQLMMETAISTGSKIQYLFHSEFTDSIIGDGITIHPHKEDAQSETID